MLLHVAGLLARPASEWAVIAKEKSDAASVYRSHIALLAAVPALSKILGLAFAGGRYLGATAIITAVTAAMVGYLVALALPLAAATVVASMAPRFKSDGGIDEAVKLVGYSMTPFWLAGLFYLSVTLSPLVVLGLAYSVYLLFLGTTPLMGTSVDQRVPLTLVATIAVLGTDIAITWVIGLLRLPQFGF